MKNTYLEELRVCLVAWNIARLNLSLIKRLSACYGAEFDGIVYEQRRRPNNDELQYQRAVISDLEDEMALLESETLKLLAHHKKQFDSAFFNAYLHTPCITFNRWLASHLTLESL